MKQLAMAKFAILLLLLISSCCRPVDSDSAKLLQLSVYYETLCNDSIRFITTQLFPTYQLFGGIENEVFEIDLVPYGKANTTLTSSSNGEDYTFSCHHPPDECDGNMMHACALKHLPKHQAMEFIYCTMETWHPPTAGPTCALQLSLNYSIIQKCLNTDGPSLLADFGRRTKSLEPELNWVPWIIYNSKFSQRDLDESQENLLAVICGKLQTSGGSEHPYCSVKSNSPGRTSQALMYAIMWWVSWTVWKMYS